MCVHLGLCNACGRVQSDQLEQERDGGRDALRTKPAVPPSLNLCAAFQRSQLFPFPHAPSTISTTCLYRFVTELVHREHTHIFKKGDIVHINRALLNSLDFGAGLQHGHSFPFPCAPSTISIPCLHRCVTQLVHREHPHISGKKDIPEHACVCCL